MMTAIDQVQGHGEAAVKLQRNWISDPQTLPYAQHIKPHALVVLVQKGLQYYEIEQSINQVRCTLSTNHDGIMVSDALEWQWHTIITIIISVVFWSSIGTSHVVAERRGE